jgi:Holliday junction DNA helicase RuvA
MISTIHGVVRSLSEDKVVIEVGGVGLSVNVTHQAATVLNIGVPALLHTSLVVREDSLTLFGFLDEESRQLFELVQTVSGIGPKVALSILGALTPNQLGLAIAQEDTSVIEKVPGIGRKGAARMVLELKGKVVGGLQASSQLSHHQPVWREQLVSALISLGYSAKDSDNAVSAVVADMTAEGTDPATVELSQLLKMTLQAGGKS